VPGEREVLVQAGLITLRGTLAVPDAALGIVVVAHGSSSSGSHSPGNLVVASALLAAGLGTFLIDLLTPVEEGADQRTPQAYLLARRLVAVVDWLADAHETQDRPVGLLGTSTGAGAALIAAAERPHVVAAVVSRGGRPDLAGACLEEVRAPTLLIVGGSDRFALGLNRLAEQSLRCRAEVHVVDDAGALEAAAELAGRWFVEHLQRARGALGGAAPEHAEPLAPDLGPPAP